MPNKTATLQSKNPGSGAVKRIRVDGYLELWREEDLFDLREDWEGDLRIKIYQYATKKPKLKLDI